MTADPGDSVPAATRRRQRAHRATSDELVQAALRVIARDGVAAATTRKIADEAQVPLGTVHYWFSDKNELLADVVRAVVGRLEGAVVASGGDGGREGGATEGDRFGDDVRRGLHAAWGEVVSDDPGAQLGMYELTALALRTPGMRHLAGEQYAGYREFATRALAPVVAGLDPARAALVAELLAVTFDGLCLAWLADPERTHPTAVLDLLAELLSPTLASGP